MIGYRICFEDRVYMICICRVWGYERKRGVNDWKNGLAFVKYGRIRFGEEDQELSFGHIQAEMPMQHPSDNDKEAN